MATEQFLHEHKCLIKNKVQLACPFQLLNIKKYPTHLGKTPLFPQETMNMSLRHVQHLLLITYSIGIDILS